MFGLNSRCPESQTCTNVFNGSELHSNLPERHKLSNYAWHKTEPGEGQAEEGREQLPLTVPAVAGEEARRPLPCKWKALAGPEQLATPTPHKPGCFLFLTVEGKYSDSLPR